MKKNITILGSTGSIGKQALEVVEKNPDSFKIFSLTANKNSELLIQQALKFRPESIVIRDETKYKAVSQALENSGICVHSGFEAINEIVKSENVDIVLVAMVGYSGLLPTINAITSGKDIALANKETLVVAGDLITKMIKENNVKIIPVDSEHSAIFQCLEGEERDKIEKIYLTASGGPFRGKSLDKLNEVTISEALNHPNWNMGDKVTIDSASLMNKGLEVIEAKWLFNLSPEQISVIIHPQSIIHSIVQFIDGSMKAQMGLPDMKLPIQFALGYPERLRSDFKRFSFLDYRNLTFEEPDTNKFRNLKLAFEVLKMGGNKPCVLNAANEIAVNAFLKGKIKFLKMPDLIEKTIDKIEFIDSPSIDDYEDCDKISREYASSLLS
jgi:1-deoxy-D-xylulose-5-phosphate reductoisomerase